MELAGGKLSVRAGSSRSGAEQDGDGKISAPVGEGAGECLDDCLSFANEAQDFPAGEAAFGVIVGLMTQPLGIDKVFAKSLYFRRKLRERSVIATLPPGVTVFQSAVNLTPFRPPSGNVAGSH